MDHVKITQHNLGGVGGRRGKLLDVFPKGGPVHIGIEGINKGSLKRNLLFNNRHQGVYDLIRGVLPVLTQLFMQIYGDGL